MVLSQHRCAIGSFSDRIDGIRAQQAEQCWISNQISVVAKDTDRDAQFDGLYK